MKNKSRDDKTNSRRSIDPGLAQIIAALIALSGVVLTIYFTALRGEDQETSREFVLQTTPININPTIITTNEPEPKSSQKKVTEESSTPSSPDDSALDDIAQDIFVLVEGHGYADDSSGNEIQKEQSAIRAAEIVAKARFAEWLDGSDIETITIVNDGKLTIDVIRNTIKSHIPSSTIVEKIYNPETLQATVILKFPIISDN